MGEYIDYSAYQPKPIPKDKVGIYLKNNITGKYARWDERLIKQTTPVPVKTWVEVPAEEFYNYLSKPLPERYLNIPAARIQKADTPSPPAQPSEDTALLENANSALMLGVSDGGENNR
jgi:hypothetical protein